MSARETPRCRWRGNNVAELREFVERHGGAVEFLGRTIGPGLVRLTAYLLPHGQVIRPGAWLERVAEFPAGEERGWRCERPAPKPIKRTRNGRKPWR